MSWAKCILFFALLALAACKSITTGTVFDVDLAKARIICDSDVNLRIDEKSCIGEENARLVLENIGNSVIAGILVNIDNKTIELNETLIIRQILSKEIRSIAHGNLTLIPRIIVNEKTFDCKNKQIKVQLRNC